MEPEKYAEKFSSTVTNGFIALEIAIGHTLGLFDSLKKFTSPVTSSELAVSCKLKERYVREWLGCMSAAGFVSITPDDKYFIPEACKPHTGSSGLASVLPLVAANTSSLLECFKEDGPKGYDYSNQFDTLMWLDHDQRWLINDYNYNYPKSDHDKKSCDSEWINENLYPVGYKDTDTITNVLDFGCGPGSLTIKLAEHLPNAKVYGVDLDRKSIEKAKKNKAKQNIPNVEFILLEHDHLEESWTKKFDWITMVDVFHDLPNPNLGITDIKRVLKDDGIVSAVDPCVHSDHKKNQSNQSAAMLYVFSTFICLPCSMSSEPAAANGIGWGVQNRAEFIKSNGLKILGEKHNGLVQFQKA